MVKVVNSVSDALNAMQKENVGLKARVKADLQRAPVRGARLKGCSNGKRNEAGLGTLPLLALYFFLCLCSFCFPVFLIHVHPIFISSNWILCRPISELAALHYSLKLYSAVVCLSSVLPRLHPNHPRPVSQGYILSTLFSPLDRYVIPPSPVDEE